MAGRKASAIKTKPNYVVEDFKNPPKSQVKGYRTVRNGDHLVRVAVLKSGKTVATSLWHPRSERKSSNPSVTQALKRNRKR